LIYGYTFDPGLSPRYDAALREFRALFGLRLTSPEPIAGTYVDWRARVRSNWKKPARSSTRPSGGTSPW